MTEDLEGDKSICRDGPIFAVDPQREKLLLSGVNLLNGNLMLRPLLLGLASR